jgi:alanine dehydrogenase
MPMPHHKFFAQNLLETQPETRFVSPKFGKLYIGIPKETTLQENRVPLVPSSVAVLTGRGHRVVVESMAGIKSHYTDHEFSEAGAEIAYTREKVFAAHVLLKIAPPNLEEIDLMHPHQIVISPLQVPTVTEEYLNRLRQKRVTALAMEYIKDEPGYFPIVRIMSEIAGQCAILTAAELLSSDNGGVGILLGGISGVPPAKVVILGGGVVAEFATRTAMGLGAEVRIFDNNIHKLMRLQTQLGRQLYTSALNPVQLEEQLRTADVAIGAIHSSSGRTPLIVREETVAKMKQGSVIIDVSIDQGGCFETSQLTSHDKPTFRQYDVIHYCVPNIPSRVPRTASNAVSNILTSILLRCESAGNMERLLANHAGLMNGIYICKGNLTNKYLSQQFNMKYTHIELVFTANL